MTVKIKFSTGNLKKLATKYNEGTTVLDIGFLNAKSTFIAKIQEFGCKIPVTKKMRGWFAYTHGVHLKKTTTEIVIPPRPFMRMTYSEHKTKWLNLVKTMLKKDFGVDQIAGILGEEIKADIQDKIMSGKFVSNSSFTIMRKGRDQPLIDTGEMLKSVDYSVTKK